MVFVKVRETYDLHTIKDKMTVIAIHTPNPDIIRRNYPGLLMQCKAYRPYSCDVKIACASLQSLDPLGVGTEAGDMAPEDVFNPILYKAMSNFGMSQLEARINGMNLNPSIYGADVSGSSAWADVDTPVPSDVDQFNAYYGLLANTHEWKHANPQEGLVMTGLKPLVYEMLYSVGDNAVGSTGSTEGGNFDAPGDDHRATLFTPQKIRGNAKPLPFINCTAYSLNTSGGQIVAGTTAPPGFPYEPQNAEVGVPWINCVVAAVVCPPSRRHSLYYRMVVEWTLEFSTVRPLSEIVSFSGLAALGGVQHYINYSYEATKEALTGSRDTILDNDTCMASANVGIEKVM